MTCSADGTQLSRRPTIHIVMVLCGVQLCQCIRASCSAGSRSACVASDCRQVNRRCVSVQLGDIMICFCQNGATACWQCNPHQGCHQPLQPTGTAGMAVRSGLTPVHHVQFRVAVAGVKDSIADSGSDLIQSSDWWYSSGGSLLRICHMGIPGALRSRLWIVPIIEHATQGRSGGRPGHCPHQLVSITTS
jgi:hypothetical protein